MTEPADLPKRAPIVVFAWGCFLAGATGAQARIGRFMDLLAARNAPVVFYSYRPRAGVSGDDAWTEARAEAFKARYPNAELVLETPSRTLSALAFIKNRLLSLAPGLARWILSRSWPGQAPELAKLKARHPEAWYVVNYANGLSQLNGLPAERAVVETHDLLFVKYLKTRRKPVTDAGVLLRQRQEFAGLNAAAGVIAITRFEAQVLGMLLDGPQIFCAPAYGDEVGAVTPHPRPAEHAHDLLFVGSGNAFNVRGLAAFIRANADWLADYRLAVCGRVCAAPEIEALAAEHAFIDRLGFVDDLGGVYAGAKACISPVDGTGLKIKVVEALYHGKPVFASEHSMSGLPAGFDRCILPLDPGAMQRLLSSRTEREATERAALDYAASFSKTSEAGALLSFLGLGDAAPEEAGAAAPLHPAPGEHTLEQGAAI